MKYFSFCLLFLFLTYSQYIFSQFEDSEYFLVDSLILSDLSEKDSVLLIEQLSTYHDSNHDTVKVQALSTIAEKMVSPVWGKYAEFALNFSEKMMNKTNLSKVEKEVYQEAYLSSLNNYGIYLGNKGDRRGSLSQYVKGLKIAKNIQNKPSISSFYNNIGYQYYLLSDFKKAIDYHYKSLKMDLELEDTSGITSSYNNLGLIYSQMKEHELALDKYLKCFEYLKNGKDVWRLGITYGNIGAEYGSLNQGDSALVYLKEAARIQKETNDLLGYSVSLGGIGLQFSRLDELDSAQIYLEEAAKVAKKIDYKLGFASSSTTLSNIYLRQNKTEKALQHAKEALETCERLETKSEKKDVSFTLYEIYLRKKDYKNALDFYEQYNQLKDSIENIENKTLAISKDEQFKYKQQALKDSLEQEKEKDLLEVTYKKEEEKQLLRAWFLGILSFSGIVFGGFIFTRLRVTKKQKKIIETQKTEVDHAYDVLEDKNQEITDSINYAKRIQSAILPPINELENYNYNSFILYLPKDIVAGDFYWIEPIGDSVLFAAADCTGHGVPGAIVSVICNSALNRSVREFGLDDPGEILDKSREIVINEFIKSTEDVKDGMDIALCKISKQTLEFAGAQNPLWILRGNEIIEIKANKQPIGSFENKSPFTTHKVDLQKEDIIYIFSDGYADQFGGVKGKKLKSRPFKELLLSIKELPMNEQKIKLNEFFIEWRGDVEQLDDVCLIGLKV
ncbi:MAG: hypothetical protein COA32_16620 [Fluviicola sp.]|nr:MAG: hypothetical protein COA32_16620 [Fluviicola sp.]